MAKKVTKISYPAPDDDPQRALVVPVSVLEIKVDGGPEAGQSVVVLSCLNIEDGKVGRVRTVTGDVRLSPEGVPDWLADNEEIMGAISDCVHKHLGDK